METGLDIVGNKYMLAGSHELNEEAIWTLAVDDCHQIRRRIAENPKCPTEVLVALSSDDHEDVRIAVSEHREVPRVVLHHLAEDESSDVRYALAENANVALEVLQKLAEDENPYVSYRARRTLKIINPTSVVEMKGRPIEEIHLASM